MTGWLDCFVNSRPFTAVKIGPKKLNFCANVGSKFCPYKINPQNCPKTFKICQDGEIWPNLVSLIGPLHSLPNGVVLFKNFYKAFLKLPTINNR